MSFYTQLALSLFSTLDYNPAQMLAFGPSPSKFKSDSKFCERGLKLTLEKVLMLYLSRNIPCFTVCLWPCEVIK